MESVRGFLYGNGNEYSGQYITGSTEDKIPHGRGVYKWVDGATCPASVSRCPVEPFCRARQFDATRPTPRCSEPEYAPECESSAAFEPSSDTTCDSQRPSTSGWIIRTPQIEVRQMRSRIVVDSVPSVFQRAVDRCSAGSLYEGDFENGHRNGFGVYSFPTGDRCVVGSQCSCWCSVVLIMIISVSTSSMQLIALNPALSLLLWSLQ